jgi:hypothetical protein
LSTTGRASHWRRIDVREIWVQRLALAGSLQTVTAVAITILVLLGIAALAGGATIVLFASRRAPDGFEDQDGFHVGQLPSARHDMSREGTGVSVSKLH